MSIALRTTLAAAGTILALLPAPSMAEMSLAEQQRVARILADQGFSNIRFSELDREVIVLADRDSSIQSFAYLNGNGGLVSVGMKSGAPPVLSMDRGRDGHESDYSSGFYDGSSGRGQVRGGGGVSDN